MFCLLPYANEYLIEAGCDEAGRGCLAGPVVAAAVILPKKFRHPLLTDSKLLSHQKRNELRTIIEKEAVAFNVGFVSPVEIDKINILKASFLAMHRAIEGLFMQPDWLMIDGNRFDPYKHVPHTCVVKGDAKFLHIAAASILAKTYRDQYMYELHQAFPFYHWDKNKGYPTKEHRTAIREFGACEHHRKSFTLVAPEQLSLF